MTSQNWVDTPRQRNRPSSSRIEKTVTLLPRQKKCRFFNRMGDHGSIILCVTSFFMPSQHFIWLLGIFQNSRPELSRHTNWRMKCATDFTDVFIIYRFSRSRNAPNLKNQSEIILKLLFRVVSSLSVPRSRVYPSELRFTQFNQSTNKHLSGTLGLFNSRVGFSEFTSVNCLAKRLNVERTQTPLGQKRFLFFQRTSPFSNHHFATDSPVLNRNFDQKTK